jgi:hypothetical protein
MNKRAITVLKNIASLQRQAEDAMQMLLDNPDDAELSIEQEQALRQVLDTITTTAKTLQDFK